MSRSSSRRTEARVVGSRDGAADGLTGLRGEMHKVLGMARADRAVWSCRGQRLRGWVGAGARDVVLVLGQTGQVSAVARAQERTQMNEIGEIAGIIIIGAIGIVGGCLIAGLCFAAGFLPLMLAWQWVFQ